MSVEPLARKSGRVWRVRWRDHNGQPRSRVLGRKADAESFDQEIKRRKRMGELAQYEAGSQSLAAFAEEWWKLYAEPNLAERTLKSYAGLWDRHVLPHLGDVQLRELGAPVLEAHLSELRAAGVGAPTVHRVYVVLSSVLQRAFEWGRISENPCRRVRSRAPRRERQVVPLTDEQITALMDATWRPRDRFIIGAIAYGGFRPSELCALTWDDVGYDHVYVTKATEPVAGVKNTKTNVDRRVPMNDTLREVFNALFDEAQPTMGEKQYVVVKADGKPFNDSTWNTWHKDVWSPIRKATGIGSVPYDLRHTYISRLIADGADVVKVAKYAGNSPATTLTVYAHLFDD